MIAELLVDKDGIVIEDNGITVSSFAWGLPLALKKSHVRLVHGT
jgi:hypothetical protein